jgi:AcrR family transcriptional regulator
VEEIIAVMRQTSDDRHDAVMRGAGLSRTVFYRYFDGLAHVVISLLDDLIDQIVDLTVAAGRPGGPEVLRAGL